MLFLWRERKVKMSNEEIMRQFVLAQVGCPYVYGATGQKCTPAYRRARQAQYLAYAENIAKYCPVLSGKQANCTGCKHEGRLAYDCAQLTRRMMELIGLEPPSGAKSQHGRKSLYIDSGPISQLPPGRLAQLFRVREDGSVPHTGVAIGDGTAVDARGHAQGVIRTPVSSFPWTTYKIIAGTSAVNGGNTEEVTHMMLMIGSSGAAVSALQQALVDLGHDLGTFGTLKNGVDGKFGSATDRAVREFQQATDLPQTGIWGTEEQEELDKIKAAPDPVPDTDPPEGEIIIRLPHSAAQALFDALKGVI